VSDERGVGSALQAHDRDERCLLAVAVEHHAAAAASLITSQIATGSSIGSICAPRR